MSKLDILLSGLDKCRGSNGRWSACCPAHDDKSPSLSIRETEDGRVLLHCFSGCSVESILGAVGLTFEDLYPERPQEYRKPEKRVFAATDLLRVLSFEAVVVSIMAYDISEGKTIKPEDMERAKTAFNRIEEVMRYAGI